MGRRARGDRGDSGPLEMVILLPAVLLLFGLVVAFGRTTTASQHVEHAAAVGARAAAGAQTAGGAGALAADVVGRSLAQYGMTLRAARGRWHVHARRAGLGHRHVRRRPRRRHEVRLHSRVADAHRDGERGHRPHEGWVMRLRGITRQRLVARRHHAPRAVGGGRARARRRSPVAGAARRQCLGRVGGARRRSSCPSRRSSDAGLDAGLATQRASAELASQGVDGSVAVSGQSVTVTVTEPVDYLILPGGRSVSSSSTASPAAGIGSAP